MKWSTAIVSICVMAFIYGLLSMVRGCGVAEDEQQTMWTEFVKEHHCKVKPTPWYVSNTWQCDGFEIEHY